MYFTYFKAIFITKTEKNLEGGRGEFPPGNNQNRNQFACLRIGVDPLNFDN